MTQCGEAFSQTTMLLLSSVGSWFVTLHLRFLWLHSQIKPPQIDLLAMLLPVFWSGALSQALHVKYPNTQRSFNHTTNSAVCSEGGGLNNGNDGLSIGCSSSGAGSDKCIWCFLLLTHGLSLRSGLGYILGSSAKVAAGDWHWALRVRARSSSLSSSNMHTQRQTKKAPPAGLGGEACHGSGVNRVSGDRSTGRTHMAEQAVRGSDIVGKWHSGDCLRLDISHTRPHQWQLSLQPPTELFLKMFF